MILARLKFSTSPNIFGLAASSVIIAHEIRIVGVKSFIMK